MGVICAIFHNSGKYPISKKLLNSLDIEKEIGVEISPKNLPGTPQWEKEDFFKSLIIFPTSIGLVFRTSNLSIPSNGVRFGEFGDGSSKFDTLDLEGKNSLKILLFSFESFTIFSASIKEGVVEKLAIFH